MRAGLSDGWTQAGSERRTDGPGQDCEKSELAATGSETVSGHGRDSFRRGGGVVSRGRSLQGWVPLGP